MELAANDRLIVKNILVQQVGFLGDASERAKDNTELLTLTAEMLDALKMIVLFDGSQEKDGRVRRSEEDAFGAEVSPVFFGGMSSLALCEDGELVLEKVMEAVVPIFEDATGKAVAASNARKAQRLEKYRDKRVGLAPGQQI